MLSMFNKNVVFQYKLAMMLTETRELHLGKKREEFTRKARKAKFCGEHRRAASTAAPTVGAAATETTPTTVGAASPAAAAATTGAGATATSASRS